MPIINSILDCDAYKFYMQQAMFHQFPDKEAVYSFKLRNAADVCSNAFNDAFMENLLDEIKWLAQIHLTAKEKDCLRSLKLFKEDYLEYLENFRFNPGRVSIRRINSNTNSIAPEIEIKGPWPEVMMWEIPLLSIFNELYFSYCDKDKAFLNGYTRLNEKFEFINGSQIKIVDFGTRRRFSNEWQNLVLHNTKNRLAGTSNVFFAMKFGIKPVGTMAHEWIMGGQALVDPIDSQKFMLDNWKKEYGDKLSIALTDTLGNEKFLLDFNPNEWDGVRHDSGDPIAWGKKMLEFYRNWDCKKTPTFVFSDSLDFPKAMEIYDCFKNEKVHLVFGIGTNLMNDMGVTPLNIVCKLQYLDKLPVLKLSNVPTKTMSPSPTYTVNMIEKLMCTNIK